MSNRIIKFRSWNVEEKIMHNPAMPSWNGMHEVWQDNKPQSKTQWLSTNGPAEQGILMQFTGLTDKNGREIYEGDIVLFYKGYVDDTWTDTEQGRPYRIQWENASLSFRAVRENKYLTPGCGQEGKYKWSWEVIGNVYENPELLTPQTV